MPTFGQTLKSLREKTGMSQAALAEKAGMSQKAVSWWETGVNEPTLSNLQKLCTALGVDCSVFFQADEPKPAKKKK